MIKHVSSRILVLAALLGASASAQFWPVGLTSTLQWTVPAPPHLGGLTFDAAGSQLLLVGGADSSFAAAYGYTPIRDPGTSRITGLSGGTPIAPTPNADGGLELNGGLLFF